MNEVYLEGVIVSVDKPEAKADQQHVVCQLRMTHRTRQGQLRHEVYTINAWNRLADWAEKHISVGTPVFIKGHLTQRSHSGTAAVEITASRFVIRRPLPDADESQSAPSHDREVNRDGCNAVPNPWGHVEPPANWHITLSSLVYPGAGGI